MYITAQSPQASPNSKGKHATGDRLVEGEAYDDIAGGDAKSVVLDKPAAVRRQWLSLPPRLDQNDSLAAGDQSKGKNSGSLFLALPPVLKPVAEWKTASPESSAQFGSALKDAPEDVS